MNSKFIATAVFSIAALTSVSTFAQGKPHGDLDYVAPPATSSNVTQAQVQTEYFQALKAGAVASRSSSLTFVPAVATNNTSDRAAVRAEAMAWAKTHQANSIM